MLYKLNQLWLRYEYKHTTIALLIFALFLIFFDSAAVTGLFGFVVRLGYVGAFIAGALSVSFFTTALAVVALVELATKLDPIALAIVGGAGAMLFDWILLQFFEERVFHELKPIFRKLHIHRFMRRLQHRYTRWILFLAGMLVIATPLPDEVGIALLGISHFKQRYLFVVTFVLNTIGILAFVLAVRAVA